MFKKKVEKAFDNLKVRLIKLDFTNTIGYRSTDASSTWRGREREIGESEMNH